MNDAERLKVPKDIFDVKESLDTAMGKAGGDPSRVTLERLEKVSALDLLCTLAPNGVVSSHKGDALVKQCQS